MKILSANIVFGIAMKWRLSTLAKIFVITFRIFLTIGILPSSRFCETMQETLKSTKKKDCLASCSRCGYKVELNIFCARETEKIKSGVRYYVANCKNYPDSIITAKEWQLVNHIILLLKPFFCSK